MRHPAAAIVHEIPEPSGFRLEGVEHETSIDGMQARDIGAEHAAPDDVVAQDQRAGVVIDAVAMFAVRHGKAGMLEDAAIVRHPLDRLQGDGRISRTVQLRDMGAAAAGARGLGNQAGQALGKYRPAGRLRPCVNFAAARCEPFRIPQLGHERGADGLGIGGGHQRAGALRQRLLGMPVRRGDDVAAERERVAERAGRDLRRVEVRRDVDVARLQVIEQFLIVDEPVDELDIGLDTETDRQRFKRAAIGFALARHQMRMRHADDKVARLRKPREDFRHRADHAFNTLVGRQEAESGNHVLAVDPERPARLRRLGVGPHRRAVRNHAHPAGRRAVDIAQHSRAALRHHDEA